MSVLNKKSVEIMTLIIIDIQNTLWYYALSKISKIILLK